MKCVSVKDICTACNQLRLPKCTNCGSLMYPMKQSEGDDYPGEVPEDGDLQFSLVIKSES